MMVMAYGPNKHLGMISSKRGLVHILCSIGVGK